MVDSRNYEFAAHITTQMDEAKVPAVWSEVEQLISKHGGVITFSQQPQPKRLSYPIKHQSQSFFGWVQFTVESADLLPELDEWARLHTEVLRHIVLKLEPESDKRALKQAAHLERKAAKAAKEGAAVKKTTTEEKAKDSGKLEQQIEDVLGNI
jgi:ribosomal protein S6